MRFSRWMRPTWYQRVPIEKSQTFDEMNNIIVWDIIEALNRSKKNHLWLSLPTPLFHLGICNGLFPFSLSQSLEVIDILLLLSLHQLLLLHHDHFAIGFDLQKLLLMAPLHHLHINLKNIFKDIILIQILLQVNVSGPSSTIETSSLPWKTLWQLQKWM